MDGQATSLFLRHFQDLPDPRAHNVVHRLHDMIVLAVCAVICGADGWAQVELFAHSKLAWFKTFLDLPGGIPSHDTFGRLFARLDPDAFERAFGAWAAALAGSSSSSSLSGGGGGPRLIAIDGKAIRRSFEHAWDKSGMAHLVSAFVVANDDRVVFAQRAVADKSNEIMAIPHLLALLDLAGATVTADAMGCQREVARQVVAGGGDYVLSLKDNQPTLHGKVQRLLDEAIATHGSGSGSGVAGLSLGRHQSADQAHGRRETRTVWVSDEVHWIQDHLGEPWPHLGSIAAVESVRQDLGDLSGQATTERRYFVSSRAGTDAAAMAAAIRGHWSVENNLHWQLDVSFGEDQRRIRSGHGAENFSRLARLALNLLKKDKTVKAGIRGKRLKAGWDEHYLLRLLTQ
jgi:predicted transposase YbfD/YdcC